MLLSYVDFKRSERFFSIIFVTNIYMNHKIKRLLKIYCTSLIVLNNRMLCETREITKIKKKIDPKI